MAQRPDKKRLGKKHRQASTRPKKGRAPRVAPVTGAVAPRKRKAIATKKAELEKKRRLPTRSPERESAKTISPARRPRANDLAGRDTPHSSHVGITEPEADVAAWKEAEKQAAAMSLDAADHATGNRERSAETSLPANLPLIAICGRPNVGKSTLFNRLTGSRRSIVGDEPGITRDRIYGAIEWLGRDARLVDTGGVIPDDPELIPTEIFRQARTALDEADAIVMVVDGRTELASPDLELARLLLRGGKPIFLAVNKMDSVALLPQAENFRQLGFSNVLPISAEHGNGMGDLLDEVFAVLPEPADDEEIVAPEAFLTEQDEMDEDRTGPDFTEAAGATLTLDQPHPHRATDIRTETKIAIIGRPNVGKSTLLNALTGSDRAIVSPIAGTTRDAVDEVIIHDGQTFRFIDTAGIRRKGKTRLMAEKLSVVMARRHLEAADIALLVIDASEGVHALDAHIGGYAHESGRSVVIVVNKWDLVGDAPRDPDTPKPTQKSYEESVRYKLKFLDYAPVIFLSASQGRGIDGLYKKIELVARERRKRISTGQMNRLLAGIDFQAAGVPMKRRVKIYYMTQAAVAPPTFVLFTDRDTPLHFSFERFLANQIRAQFRFIGTPLRFKTRPRNKKRDE